MESHQYQVWSPKEKEDKMVSKFPQGFLEFPEQLYEGFSSDRGSNNHWRGPYSGGREISC